MTQFRAFFCGGYLPHILRTSSATSAKMEKKVIVVECRILYPPHIFRKGRGDYHQCDESEDIDHTLNFMRVYAMSIVALNGMDVGKEK